MTLLEVYNKIWHYYYGANDKNYIDASNAIRKLDITDIVCLPEEVVIVLRRPGLLIGPKGKNIECLQKALGMPIRIEEKREASIADQIIPYDYDLSDDLWGDDSYCNMDPY